MKFVKTYFKSPKIFFFVISATLILFAILFGLFITKNKANINQLYDSNESYESVLSNSNNLEFMYMENSKLYVGDNQDIYISFYDENYAKNSTLTFHKEGYDKTTISPVDIRDNVAKFSIPFKSKKDIGNYTFDTVNWNTFDSGYQTIDSSDKGYSFSVTEQVENLSKDELPAGIYTLSKDGSVDIFNKICANDAQMMLSQAALSYKRDPNKALRVCLDPGHGGSDPGASYGNLEEKWLNLIIAQACRDELLQYSGVEVIMTRDDDRDVGLQERCDIARDNNCDLFVCIHNNSGGGTGSEVWVQYNGCSWHNEFNQIGSDIGNKILDKLNTTFGLINRGIKSRTNDERFYPDGSIGDYYAVLYWSRLYEIPGILIEHAFIDTDYNFLSNPDNLIGMGKIDAQAIAEYYGLSKDIPQAEVSWMDDSRIAIRWNEVKDATKYAVYRCENGEFIPYTEDYHNTEIEIDNLNNGEEYTFLVQAYKDGHWSPFTERNYLITRLLPVPRPIEYQCTGDGQVELSWNNLTNATKYSVAEYKNGEYVTYSKNIDAHSGTIKYKLDNLSCGTEHKILVQALFDNQWWSLYDTSCLTNVVAEGHIKPYNITTTATDSSITLKWNKIPGVQSYNVAITYPDGTIRNFDTGSTECVYAVDNLHPLTEYKCLVQAFYDVGSYSPFDESDWIDVKTKRDSSRPDPKCETSDGTVKLVWDKIENADKYAVYLYDNGVFVPYTESLTDCQYTISNLINKVEYKFLVQAHSSRGWSLFDETNIVRATPEGPIKPYDVTALPGTNQVKLTWGKVSGANCYAVARQISPGLYETYTASCTDCSYVVQGLNTGQTYSFLVQVNLNGKWSSFDESKDLVTCTTIDTRPVPSSEATGDGEITLNWESIKGASKYAVYEVMDSGIFIPLNENIPSSSFVATNLPNSYSHRFLVQSNVSGIWSTITPSLYTIAKCDGYIKPYDVSLKPGNTFIDANWGHVSGAQKYAVAIYLGPRIYKTFTSDCMNESYRIDGLNEGTTYKVLIQVCIYGNWSLFDESVDLSSCTTSDIRPRPNSEKYGDGQIKISWNGVENASKYAIYEVRNAEGFKPLNEKCTDLSYIASNLENGYTHIFLVQAFVDGKWSSISSELFTSAICEGPIKPYNVQALADYTSVSLNWNHVSGAIKYAVAVKQADGSYYTYTNSLTDTKFDITGLESGKTYYCLVQCYILNQWSKFDESEDLVRVTTKTDQKPIINPNSKTGDGWVDIEWTFDNQAEKFALYEVVGDNTYKKINDNITADVHNFKVDNLVNNMYHSFLVQAYYDNHWSSFNNFDFCSFYLIGTIKPKIISYDKDINKVNIHWNNVPGAEKYAIARQLNDGQYYTYTTECKNLSFLVDGIRGGDTYNILVQSYSMGRWSSFDSSDLYQVVPLVDPNRPRPYIVSTSSGCISLAWEPIPSATKYAVATKNFDGSYNTYTTSCVDCHFDICNLDVGTYSCLVQAYVDGKWSNFDNGDIIEAYVPISAGVSIMHDPRTYINQMGRYYESKGFVYPSWIYAGKGATTIYDFAIICYEEAIDEGVDPAVLFCQAMHETGWLKFGGDVKAEQCNFGGLGATGGGASGATFRDVREGLRAQVQHLKAYACFDNCVHEIVDPRFYLVTRGCAPLVTDLNGRWAVPGVGYGEAIISLMNEMKNF